jgi:hypothetical protein
MTPNTQTKPDFKEMVASVEEAATKTEEAAAEFTLPISNEDKTTILLNVEGAIKDLAAALAKKNEIKGADIDPSAYDHLPNSLTGVMVHYFVKGLKDELGIAFEEAPTSLKVRSSNPMDKKVAGKKRLLTRDQKNELLAKTQMAFYEDKIGKGEMTIEQAMYAVKDAYERKQNFEEMGYILPVKKTEYPYWADDAS